MDQALTCNLRPLGNQVYLTEFVTPRTYLVDEICPGLQRGTPQETVHACLDWVCRNIKYKGEAGDIFYRPSEALHTKVGDCEEHSFVLCSFLRNFLSPDEIFVALGTYGILGTGHAWVSWLNEKYWVLEATLERAPDEIPEQIYPYDAWILFNDVQSIELKPGFKISKQNVAEKNREIEQFYGIKVRR